MGGTDSTSEKVVQQVSTKSLEVPLGTRSYRCSKLQTRSLLTSVASNKAAIATDQRAPT